jgi:hypothetical protein
MLELRPSCENCDIDLPPESGDARICSYECTWCAACADGVLQGVCPNCTGNLVARPIRPPTMLAKHPASTQRVFKPVDLDAHRARVAALKR